MHSRLQRTSRSSFGRYVRAGAAWFYDMDAFKRPWRGQRGLIVAQGVQGEDEKYLCRIFAVVVSRHVGLGYLWVRVRACVLSRRSSRQPKGTLHYSATPQCSRW